MSTLAKKPQIITLRQLARNVSDVFRNAEHKAIIVTRHGKPVARISPYNNNDTDLEIKDNRLLEHLTNAIKNEVKKKYKNTTVPSLKKQLADL